jgi:hypothetical protein
MRHSAADKIAQSRSAGALRDGLTPLGFAEAGVNELGAIRALAAGLISPHVAGEAALHALHSRTGYGFYVLREEGWITGLIALVLLNEAGLAAVRSETFNALDPSLEHAVARNEEPAAVYGWGIAGATREAAKVIVEGSWAVLAALPEQPFFVRAATEAGRRLLTEKMSFVPYPGSTTGLLWWEHGHAVPRRAA